MKTGEKTFLPPFLVRVEKEWKVDGNEIQVGDLLCIDPAGEVQDDTLVYLRIRKGARWIGWYYGLGDGKKSFVPIDKPDPPGIDFPFEELLQIARERGQDFILYPVISIVRTRGSALNDRDPKGGAGNEEDPERR